MESLNPPYFHNLKWDEESVGPTLDIVLSHLGKGYHFNAFKLSTTTFTPILEKVDTSNSANHITFLPLEYLRTKIKSRNGEDIIKHVDQFKEKEYLFNILMSEPELVKEVLNDTYLGIPIKCLKKPIITCDIVKNQNIKNLHNTVELKTAANYRNAWFDNLTIDDMIERLIYINPSLEVVSTNTLLFDMCNDNCNGIYNYFKFKLERVLKDKTPHIVIVPLIYAEHFTVFIIDFRFKTVSFYDSGGIDPSGIIKSEGIEYIFINDNMSSNHYNIKQKPYDRLKKVIPRYNYINPCLLVIRDVLNIDCAIFNKYKQQYSRIECGAFIISFVLHYLYIDIPHQKDIIHIYNSLIMKGDLMMTYLRSCFFVTLDDLKKNNMTIDDYYKDLKVYKIDNEFYNEYLKIYLKDVDIFQDIVKDISESKREYISTNIYPRKLIYKEDEPNQHY